MNAKPVVINPMDGQMQVVTLSKDLTEVEPVAWMHIHDGEIIEFNDFKSCDKCVPLYTSPPDQSAEIERLKAHIEELRKALEEIKSMSVQSDDGYIAQNIATITLASTPQQSLQAHDDEVIERCARICDEAINRESANWIVGHGFAEAIRALKEK